MTTTSPSDKTRLEPAARMKSLVETSQSITVDNNVAVGTYFKSGRELIKSASTAEKAGDIERAFILYLRYMSLNLEKLPNHPDYKTADKEEKRLIKEECNRVFDVAENLKQKLLQKFKSEYESNQNES